MSDDVYSIGCEMSPIRCAKSDIICLFYMHYDIVRMGLVSQIKGPLSRGVKSLYHDVLPRRTELV